MPESFDFLKPSLSKLGLFNAAEIVFVVLSVIGFIYLWYKNKKCRPILSVIIILLLLIMPFFYYRRAFHYLVIQMAFGAIFVGYLISSVCDKFRFMGNKCRFALAIIAVLLMHSLSFVFIVDAKRSDILAYKKDWAAYYDALRYIDYDEKIAVIDKNNDFSAGAIYGNPHHYTKKAAPFIGILRVRKGITSAKRIFCRFVDYGHITFSGLKSYSTIPNGRQYCTG